jgi:hypothetical protein
MTRVEWELYGTTNADAVTDKTVKSLDTVEKNAKRVETAFSMSVSSIFLRFLGPMALFQAAISWISDALENSKQQAKEAMDFAIKGESAALKSSTTYLAQKYDTEDKAKKEKEMAEIANAKNTERYLREGNTMAAMNKLGVMGYIKYGLSSYADAASGEDMQNAVEELVKAERAKAGKTYQKPGMTDFKGPEGFSNVVGVGASPVLEAMTQQLQVQREMLNQLEVANSTRQPDPDFTKGITTFRATPYGL